MIIIIIILIVIIIILIDFVKGLVSGLVRMQHLRNSGPMFKVHCVEKKAFFFWWGSVYGISVLMSIKIKVNLDNT